MRKIQFRFLIIGIIGLTSSSFLMSCNGESSSEEISEIDSTYCECNELYFDEAYNHYYRFERREGFTGKCELFHPNGELQMEKNFVEGKVHGKMTTYHDNGSVYEEMNFDMNFMDGEKITYTKSGKVKFHALYKRGKQMDVFVSEPGLSLED